MSNLNSRELREIFEDSIKESATYKQLDESLKNPAHIIFNGVEIYVYIKNLSSAYFENSDVWRAQMTGVDVLNEIKDSPAMFILLGYDSDNSVYATWNPHQVKQRIGTASSPSLYSRLSLQQEVARTGEIKSMTLNNNLEVLVFPCNRLVDVLSNLEQFFPDTSDYVAMGSKRRSDANAAYKELTNTKRLDEYAKFLLKSGVTPSDVERHCQAVKRLISSNLISLHRKVFLAHDTLNEYQDAAVEFFNLDDVNEFKKQWGNLYPATLIAYIDFLQKRHEKLGKEELPQKDGKAALETEATPDEEQSDLKRDWETSYEDENGNLTKLTNPELLKLLRPYLDTEYPSQSACYNIIGDFYANRYPKMQLKDWGKLLNNIEWTKCDGYKAIPEEVQAVKQSRQKIHVQFPDGHISNHSKVMQTLVDVIIFAGPERVRNLNIVICNDNLVTSNLNPMYMNSYKEVGNGLYVNTCSDTKRKYAQIMEINDRLNLKLKVEIV